MKKPVLKYHSGKNGARGLNVAPLVDMECGPDDDNAYLKGEYHLYEKLNKKDVLKAKCITFYYPDIQFFFVKLIFHSICLL